MKYLNIFNLIKEYKTIIIHRHTNPDLDAIGSQTGLKETLKLNFTDKEIYAVGDISKRYSYLQDLDIIDDSKYEKALVIILDVSVSQLVSDDRYNKAKKILILDHHHNDTNIDNAVFIKESNLIATCEIVTNIIIDLNLKINSKAATALYTGIVSDSGRFMYQNVSENTFIVAAFLVKNGVILKDVYDKMYVETLDEYNMKKEFSSRIIFDKNIAYLINDEDIMEKYKDISFFDISRGMVSLMAGIKDIKIWANFTYNKEKKSFVGEYRSRDIEIVDIAKKYGGGGHLLACGSPIEDRLEIENIITDFKKKINNN